MRGENTSFFLIMYINITLMYFHCPTVILMEMVEACAAPPNSFKTVVNYAFHRKGLDRFLVWILPTVLVMFLSIDEGHQRQLFIGFQWRPDSTVGFQALLHFIQYVSSNVFFFLLLLTREKRPFWKHQILPHFLLRFLLNWNDFFCVECFCG